MFSISGRFASSFFKKYFGRSKQHALIIALCKFHVSNDVQHCCLSIAKLELLALPNRICMNVDQLQVLIESCLLQS